MPYKNIHKPLCLCGCKQHVTKTKNKYINFHQGHHNKKAFTGKTTNCILCNQKIRQPNPQCPGPLHKKIIQQNHHKNNRPKP